jgi:hypothetical protein
MTEKPCWPRDYRRVRPCDPVEITAPFVGTIRFDGRCLTHEPDPAVLDGVYGRFVVEGGRVTRFLPETVPAYTPPPCAATPEPCDDCEGEGVELSTDAANLSKLDVNGRLLTQLVVSSSGNVQISGNGTASNPLRVTVVESSSQTGEIVSATPDILGVAGGTVLSHLPSAGAGEIINGIEFDAYGHALKASSAGTGETGVTTIVTNPDAIEKTEQNGAVSLTLPTMFTANLELSTGRQILYVDMYGRITAVTDAVIDELDELSYVMPGGWQEIMFNFGTFYSGYMRVTYTGDLGFTTSGAYGLGQLTTGCSALLDTLPLQAFIRYDGGRAVGFEARSTMEVLGGSHVLALTVPSPVPNDAMGILDIGRCRS